MDVINEQTQTTRATEEADISAHADDVREQMNARTSESTTRAEREQGALQGERERAARLAAVEGEPTPTVPDERPPGNLFDDPNAPTRTGEPLERPPLRQEVRDTIDAAARTNEHGQFVDADGNVIQDPHYGHIAGHENRRIIAAGEELGLTQAQLNEYVNARPEFFQIEEGPFNISHQGELPGLEPYDHIIDDMIKFFNL